MQLPTRRVTSYTFFGLLERTFAIYRENFATIFGIVALVVVPITLLQYLINPAQITGNVEEALRTSSSGSQLRISILNFIQTILVYGPLTYVASESLFGQRVTISAAFGAISNRFGKLGCGLILMGIIIGLLAVGLVLLFSVFAAPALALVGLLFCHRRLRTPVPCAHTGRHRAGGRYTARLRTGEAALLGSAGAGNGHRPDQPAGHCRDGTARHTGGAVWCIHPRSELSQRRRPIPGVRNPECVRQPVSAAAHTNRHDRPLL